MRLKLALPLLCLAAACRPAHPTVSPANRPASAAAAPGEAELQDAVVSFVDSLSTQYPEMRFRPVGGNVAVECVWSDLAVTAVPGPQRFEAQATASFRFAIEVPDARVGSVPETGRFTFAPGPEPGTWRCTGGGDPGAKEPFDCEKVASLCGAPRADAGCTSPPVRLCCGDSPCPMPAAGYEQRLDVIEAFALAQLGEIEAADVLLGRALRRLEARLDGARPICVASAAELERARQAAPGQSLVQIDWAYGLALHAEGALASERKDWETALGYLERGIQARPFAPESRAERGFVLNQIGRFDEALALYEGALELATTARMKAVALRGASFALIELGRLDEAEAKLRQALEHEPASPATRNELRYIEQLRKKGP
jgi:tetratricopeptide (TPR) repeat protein